MKLPFYTVIGPPLKRYYKSQFSFCNFPVFNLVGGWYVLLIAVTGMLFSVIDIIRIMKDGPRLPPSLLRSRIKSDQVVSPEIERDVKLMASTVTLEYHFLLVVGIVTNHPVFFMPWLFMQGLIIVLECVVFFLRMACTGVCMDRRTMISVVLTPIHWLAVSCFFKNLISPCDL